jgi:hypothetical protein
MKKLKIILWLCLPLLVSSCLQIGNDTLILPEEDYVGGLEETIDKDIISEKIQNNIEKNMPIYEGKTPPVVDGVYLISPMVAVYASDSEHLPDEFDDFTIKFSDQDKRNSLKYEGKYYANSVAEGSDEVTIIGKGKNFTAYFTTTGLSEGISIKKAVVISGTLTSSGIKNLYYSFVVLEKGYDPNKELMNVGEYRIFTDSDGLAENTTWNKSTKINSQEHSVLLRAAIVPSK